MVMVYSLTIFFSYLTVIVYGIVLVMCRKLRAAVAERKTTVSLL